MSPINTCVLGVGLSGLTFHVPFILALPDLFILHSVLERNPTTPHGKTHERFGVTPKVHRSLEDVLKDQEIELIIVGTPNETHYSFAKAALEAGKHVLVDKPVTSTASEGRELDALAKAKGLVLYPFQNRRFDSDFLALRKLLALPKSSAQSLGDIYEFESRCVGYPHAFTSILTADTYRFDRYRAALKGTWKDEPKPAAGQTFDLGTHIMDQALTLFGKPSKLTAFVQNVRGLGNPEVDDSFTIYMQYPAGGPSEHPLTVILRGQILSVRQKQTRYVVRGSKGTFEKSGVDIQEDQLRVLKAPSDVFGESYGLEPEAIWGSLENLGSDGSVVQTTWPSTERGAYPELFKNLANVIRNGAEQEVKWSQAVDAVELIQLAHKSSKEGITIVF
ncbi:NAD-P-binding protein [Cylindrobasidium torrendii FP15055 ss-10]|uniref:NAD-P-binding protein n=1 Tax=Cylindrobasidium torrendii FP15055 ss-10 TaxID=1314674 RepID=A0A0D7BTB0_9AGAR|nr:NAD-P-binding protein [Cylindrobasidium torrendii FP15055 ss-10]